MKIIVSTAWFPKAIEKALHQNLENFVIDGENSTIEFYKHSRYFRENITITTDSKKEVFRAKINLIQWYKMSEFIKQLEEQPIVIEFDNEEETRIRLIQFVKSF